MLLNIVGWFYVISGVICFIKPNWMQNKLKKKSMKKIRRVFFALAITISGLLIKATWGLSGVTPKIICILGFIGLFKGLYFLKAKAAEKLIHWLSNQSLQFYRMWSVFMISVGVFFIYFLKYF